MLEAQANAGAKVLRRPRVAQYTEPFSFRVDKVAAAAIADLSAREGKARGWIVAELVIEGLKRVGALAEPTDRAA